MNQNHPGVISLRGCAAAVAAGLVVAGCTVQQVRDRFADYHAKRGESAIARDDYEAAMREFSAAVRLSPQVARPYSRIGEIYRKQGDFNTAVAYYSEAVRLDPFDFGSAFSLGEVYELLATRTAERIRQLEAAIRAYLHARDLKPDSATVHLNLGMCYNQLGRYDLATDHYRNAIGLDPKNVMAYTNLGAVYQTQGKFYEAIRAYKSALEIDTQQAMVHVNLGTIYLQQDRLSAAIHSFELALKADPNSAAAHAGLAGCRLRERRLEEALEGFDRALSLDSKLADAYRDRGSVQMALYLSNRERAELRGRAVEDWHRSLELDPDQPRVRGLLTKYAPVSASADGAAKISDAP